MKKRYRVAKSSTHGKGVFAAATIIEGAILGYCKVKKAKEQGMYTLTLEGNRLFDVTCTLKYINHGRPANVSYYDDFSVVALRDIAEGEELLHDYGEEWV